MGVPALCVRQGEPPEEIGYLAVRPAFRPHDEVPVVRHDTIREQSQRFSRMCFFHRAFESGEIGILLEQRYPRIRAVHNVINQTTFNGTGSTRHAENLPEKASRVKNKRLPSPFLRLPLTPVPPGGHNKGLRHGGLRGAFVVWLVSPQFRLRCALIAPRCHIAASVDAGF